MQQAAVATSFRTDMKGAFDTNLNRLVVIHIKAVRNRNGTFLLPNMIERFEMNQMSHSPPFPNDFSL